MHAIRRAVRPRAQAPRAAQVPRSTRSRTGAPLLLPTLRHEFEMSLFGPVRQHAKEVSQVRLRVTMNASIAWVLGLSGGVDATGDEMRAATACDGADEGSLRSSLPKSHGQASSRDSLHRLTTRTFGQEAKGRVDRASGRRAGVRAELWDRALRRVLVDMPVALLPSLSVKRKK